MPDFCTHPLAEFKKKHQRTSEFDFFWFVFIIILDQKNSTFFGDFFFAQQFLVTDADQEK